MEATIFFAHGSRDPAWRECIDNVVHRACELAPQALVVSAFLELMQPDLASSVAQLNTRGVTRVTIVPLFLGLGKHAREDLPNLLRELRLAYPAITFDETLSAGADPGIIDALAKLAFSRPS